MEKWIFETVGIFLHIDNFKELLRLLHNTSFVLIKKQMCLSVRDPYWRIYIMHACFDDLLYNNPKRKMLLKEKYQKGEDRKLAKFLKLYDGCIKVSLY